MKKVLYRYSKVFAVALLLLQQSLPVAPADQATTPGTLWAWGDGRLGGLGNETTNYSITPVQVSGLTGGPWLSLQVADTVWR